MYSIPTPVSYESVTSTTKSKSAKHLSGLLTLCGCWRKTVVVVVVVVVVETLRPIYGGESGRDGGVSASFAAPSAVFGAVHPMGAAEAYIPRGPMHVSSTHRRTGGGGCSACAVTAVGTAASGAAVKRGPAASSSSSCATLSCRFPSRLIFTVHPKLFSYHVALYQTPYACGVRQMRPVQCYPRASQKLVRTRRSHWVRSASLSIIIVRKRWSDPTDEGLHVDIYDVM
ncbi:hypothetical protein B296_00015568 [Ensete ventricosum]|uniref:Uncharacterized protein n=1 Tax=Ensete ventricosum TaxID=4639 RepID=A0A426YSB3_ENSVE|nr:hypothetical protein B296_00015568 [Ensete ventricosum]